MAVQKLAIAFGSRVLGAQGLQNLMTARDAEQLHNRDQNYDPPPLPTEYKKVLGILGMTQQWPDPSLLLLPRTTVPLYSSLKRKQAEVMRVIVRVIVGVFKRRI